MTALGSKVGRSGSSGAPAHAGDHGQYRPGLSALQWAVLAALLAAFTAIPGNTATAWHFFSRGAELMFGGGPDGGIHTYASTPELQSGPLTYLVAWPATAVPGRGGRLAAMVTMLALALVIVAVVMRLAGDRVARRTRFLAAACLMPAWVDLAWRAAHLDDALTLTLTVAALAARMRGRLVTSGVLVGLAIDAKPWAVVFVVLLLPTDRSQWRRSAAAIGVAGALIAAAWLPFVLLDSRTLPMLRAFTIPNEFDSGLRALGVTDARTPAWDRPVQLVLGLGLGAVAMWRRRVWAVPVVGIAARLSIDPGAHTYYAAGVLVVCLLADGLGGLWRWPWASVSALVLVWLPGHALPLVPAARLAGAGVVTGAVKVGFLAVLAVLVLVLPGVRPRAGAPEAARARPAPG